jgi:hypothetical protein
MVLHETLTAALGPFLIPIVLFVVGGVFYIVLWWFGHTDFGGQRSQR